DDQPAGHERLEGAGQLVAAARDVVRVPGVLGDDDRGGGLHLGGGLGRNGLADGDPPGGDQLPGVFTRAREPAAYQLRVETAACDSCHVRFSSCVRVPTGV